MNGSLHENYARNQVVQPGTEKSFGIVMAVAFGVIAAIGYWHQSDWWPWLLGIAALFLISAFMFPSVLGGVNRLWFKFGMLLHRIVNPVILGLTFFLTVLPTGLVMRAMGKDLLRLKRDPRAETYWIRRPRGEASQSMKDQF